MKKFIKFEDTSNAFTLFELVLVVLILGLVISIAQINLKQDRLMQGAKQILNDIRYVRTLAMTQESFRDLELAVAKREWYKVDGNYILSIQQQQIMSKLIRYF